MLIFKVKGENSVEISIRSKIYKWWQLIVSSTGLATQLDPLIHMHAAASMWSRQLWAVRDKSSHDPFIHMHTAASMPSRKSS